MPATLTIAIPTYNRADKLERLLKILDGELAAEPLRHRVRVLVGDNASSDQTPAVCERMGRGALALRCIRHPENLRFDGNLRALYRAADTDYVWFFGDDDLPLAGAVARVLDAIDRASPDIVLSSFVQPLGSTARQFDFAEPLHLERDPRRIARHVVKYTKLSIYTLRRLDFSDAEWRHIDRVMEMGWMYIALAFAVLERSSRPSVAIYSEPLASCDEDVDQIAYVPIALLHMDVPVNTPFVHRHEPGLVREFADFGYRAVVRWCLGAKFGTIVPADMASYDAFIRKLPIRPRPLLRSPRTLAQLALLKLGLTHLWPSRGARARRRRA
ncbi:MAG: glycosyltransferase family 2 protein [Gemmatimonadaceae bacterium]